jgi:hypothetical protein
MSDLLFNLFVNLVRFVTLVPTHLKLHRVSLYYLKSCVLGIRATLRVVFSRPNYGVARRVQQSSSIFYFGKDIFLVNEINRLGAWSSIQFKYLISLNLPNGVI